MINTQELQIRVWPNEPFSYWCKGHHSMRYFRAELLRTCGINAPFGVGRFEFCYLRRNGAKVEIRHRSEPGNLPIMIWRAV